MSKRHLWRKESSEEQGHSVGTKREDGPHVNFPDLLGILDTSQGL